MDAVRRRPAAHSHRVELPRSGAGATKDQIPGLAAGNSKTSRGSEGGGLKLLSVLLTGDFPERGTTIRKTSLLSLPVELREMKRVGTPAGPTNHFRR